MTKCVHFFKFESYFNLESNELLSVTSLFDKNHCFLSLESRFLFVRERRSARLETQSCPSLTIGFAYEESSVKSCIWFVISNPISATFNCCSLSPLSLCSHIFSSTLVFAYPSSLNSLSANVTKLERDFAPFSKMQTWWGQDGST